MMMDGLFNGEKSIELVNCDMYIILIPLIPKIDVMVVVLNQRFLLLLLLLLTMVSSSLLDDNDIKIVCDCSIIYCTRLRVI